MYAYMVGVLLYKVGCMRACVVMMGVLSVSLSKGMM